MMLPWALKVIAITLVGAAMALFALAYDSQLFVYPLVLSLWLIPVALLFDKVQVRGWLKTAWVAGCFVSPAVPKMIAATMLHDLYMGKERTFADMLFGSEARIVQLSTYAFLTLPSLIYLIAGLVHGIRKPAAKEPSEERHGGE